MNKAKKIYGSQMDPKLRFNGIVYISSKSLETFQTLINKDKNIETRRNT